MFTLRCLILFALIAPAAHGITKEPAPKCCCEPACPCGCQEGKPCECCTADPLCGWWQLWEGAEHAGFVHVMAPAKGDYLITWLYAPKVEGDSVTMRATMHGRGTRHEKSLAVAWPDAKSFGVSAYEIVSDVRIKGKSETLTKAKLPASVRLFVPTKNPQQFCAARRDLPARPGDDPQALIDSLRGLADGYLTWLAKEYDPWPMLPSSKVCEDNAHIAYLWWRATLKEAEAIGLYTPTGDPEIWNWGIEGRWMDAGGQTTNRFRQEVEEALWLHQAWNLAALIRGNAVTTTPTDYGLALIDAYDYAHQLAEHIGEANFALGRLPPPIPVWRIPR